MSHNPFVTSNEYTDAFPDVQRDNSAKLSEALGIAVHSLQAVGVFPNGSVKAKIAFNGDRWAIRATFDEGTANFIVEVLHGIVVAQDAEYIANLIFRGLAQHFLELHATGTEDDRT